jgi:hypothetical protein
MILSITCRYIGEADPVSIPLENIFFMTPLA